MNAVPSSATGADPTGPATPHAPGLPRVSVVMPTYRRPALLQRCLDAVLAQRIGLSAFEVLVVDDGHDEATRDLVETRARTLPEGRLRYLRPPVGRGPAVARNHGWRSARAALVAFTDDDTVPDVDWLAEGVRAMQDGDWVALAGRVIVPRPDDAGTAPTDHERMTRGLETAQFVTANAFVRRDALLRIGGFDERFARAWREDSDLQFRLEEIGPVGRIETARVRHPVRPEAWGVSLRQQKNVYYDALLYRKHPHRYRATVRPVPPWDYYLIVTLAGAAASLALLQRPVAAAAAATGAVLLVGAFAARRLKGTAHSATHLVEMAATSTLIPFLSVYWRLRGAWRFRTWFV